MPTSTAKKRTIRQSLEILGIQDGSVFEFCASERSDEFKVVKKIYFQQVLKAHPDKGGDAEVFREIQTSFELLRALHQGKRSGSWLFSECVEKQCGASADVDKDDPEDSYNMSEYDAEFDNAETPSYEYYTYAADEAVPLYRVEIAKSGRSMCKQTGKKSKKCSELPQGVNEDIVCKELVQAQATELIQKGEIRIGSLNEDTGSYSRWHHLRCWRVPQNVWLGVPDPDKVQEETMFTTALERMNEVVLTGFIELSPEEQSLFTRHVMDKSNWARPTTKKKKGTSGGQDGGIEAVISFGGTPQEEDEKMPAPKSSTALVKTKKQAFAIPLPRQNGCLANVLHDKRIVLTGTFPELGGGAGLSLGKDRAKALVTSFGGRVTGSISGKTDLLLVGKNPGFSKVSNARSRNIQLISLHDLKLGLESGATCVEEFEKKPAMLIQNFSTGYMGNGCALKAAPNELRAAQGLDLKRSLANGGNVQANQVGNKKASKLPVEKIRRNKTKEQKRQDEAPVTSDKEKNMTVDAIVIDVVDSAKMPPAKRKMPKRGKQGSNKRLALLGVAPHAADKDDKAAVVCEPPPTSGRRSARIRMARQQ